MCGGNGGPSGPNQVANSARVDQAVTQAQQRDRLRRTRQGVVRQTLVGLGSGNAPDAQNINKPKLFGQS